MGDVIPAIARSVELEGAKNQIFNVGGDDVFTVNTLAKTVISVLGADVGVRHVEARNEVMHAYSDHTKMHEVFGKPEVTPLSEGIAKMWAWAKDRGVTKTAKFENIELHEKLPPIWLED